MLEQGTLVQIHSNEINRPDMQGQIGVIDKMHLPHSARTQPCYEVYIHATGQTQNFHEEEFSLCKERKMTKYTTVSPAYGKDYSSAESAITDWLTGRDFILRDITSRWYGKPCSIRNAADLGEVINIRYDQLRKVAVYKPAKQATKE